MLADIVMIMGISHTEKLGLLTAYCTVVALYLYNVANRTHAGSYQRTMACTPVLAGNLLLPFLFNRSDELLTFLSICFILVWLAEFKVVGLCLKRGSLCESLDFIQFWAVLWLPITPVQVSQNPLTAMAHNKGTMPRVPSNARLGEEGGTRGPLLAGFLAKAAALGVVVQLLVRFDTPRVITEILYTVGLYTFLGMLMDGPASLASGLVGLRIAPHFDQPYLCSSLSDFWSRRWNLTAGNALRFLIYDPITEGRLVRGAKPGAGASKAVRRLGVMASFVASGIVHEVIFWYIKGYVPGVSGGWLIFFSMQGPLLAAESALRRVARKWKLEVPLWVAIPLTWAVLLAAADHFFFPPPVKSGLAEEVITQLTRSYLQLWARCQALLQR